jgi:hypothetical protein
MPERIRKGDENRMKAKQKTARLERRYMAERVERMQENVRKEG